MKITAIQIHRTQMLYFQFQAYFRFFRINCRYLQLIDAIDLILKESDSENDEEVESLIKQIQELSSGRSNRGEKELKEKEEDKGKSLQIMKMAARQPPRAVVGWRRMRALLLLSVSLSPAIVEYVKQRRE